MKKFDNVKLNNGILMPMVGLGTYSYDSNIEYNSIVDKAYKLGYRLFDTASSYDNQQKLGKSFKDVGLKRSNLFLTSKVGNAEQGYEETLKSFEKSINDLGTDYLDLFLVHWPKYEPFYETWRAMEHLYTEGYVRAIGVSNFEAHQIDRLLLKANIIPSVDQIETHPYFNQYLLRGYLKKIGICQQAWSPLGQGKIIGDEKIKEIAKKYNKSTAQIILRWHLQHGVSIIPKSTHLLRIEQNFDINGFELAIEDIKIIDKLQKGERILGAPDANYKSDLW